MTVENKNRFVTGLSDSSYVKAVDRIETKQKSGEVEVVAPEAKTVEIVPVVKTKTDFLQEKTHDN